MALEPRAVLVHRTTEYAQLLAEHGTAGQADFFLRARGLALAEVAGRHAAYEQALATVTAQVPPTWRRAAVERADLRSFVFGPEDVIVVVGQDGLVANAAKYLHGQPVIGIDTDPGRNAGVLVRNAPTQAGALLRAAAGAHPTVEERTMVRAETDDGRVTIALNEVYVGDRGHQSSRYLLTTPDGVEPQSSSGVLVGTGTGSTGWLRSAWGERRSGLALPAPTDDRLAWFVREAWPSPATGDDLTEGVLGTDENLVLHSRGEHLVCFGDGIESDAVDLSWGQAVSVAVADVRLRLVG